LWLPEFIPMKRGTRYNEILLVVGLACGLIGRFWLPRDDWTIWMVGVNLLWGAFSFYKVVIKKEW
jgi:hypothetical protein